MGKSRSIAAGEPQILLEVRPVGSSGELASRSAVPEDFNKRADEIAHSISDVIDHLRAGFRNLLEQKDDAGWKVGSVEVEFGISVQAETGVIIAKATGGATFAARIVLQAGGDKPG
jgi:hypothetical protein